MRLTLPRWKRLLVGGLIAALACLSSPQPSSDGSLFPQLHSGSLARANEAADSGADADSDLEEAVEIIEDSRDPMRDLQANAMERGEFLWGHWGSSPDKYNAWRNHSNRLIPVYTYGISLQALRDEGSIYASPERLEKLFGEVPQDTVNPDAEYFDQTDMYRLQRQAYADGKRRVILVVFDGMDWQTTYAAALYRNGDVRYTEGRGTGLTLQDYRGTKTDFGYYVTSPRIGSVKLDVNSQTVLDGARPITGGYDVRRGGAFPWSVAASRDYLMGLDRTQPHTVTDSAQSASALTAGIKSYNASVNMTVDGQRMETIAHQVQRDRGMAVGVVTSVQISHATPACTYAHNVSRNDYQDITRDLIGLPSVSHRSDPLPGMDVVIGAGWGETAAQDKSQGENFIPGSKFFDTRDLEKVSVERGGRYIYAHRTAGQSGNQVLQNAKQRAIDSNSRLLAVFGAKGGNLPFATADGDYRPAPDPNGTITYNQADVHENPSLAEMAVAGLDVLNQNPNGFWMLLEAGDVDWANHANNIDCSIGAVLSGDAAVAAVFDWIERHEAWDDTAVIITADHGHHLMINQPEVIAEAGARARELAPRQASLESPNESVDQ